MFTFFFYDYICLFSCPQNLDFDDFFILNLDIVGSSILVKYPKKKMLTWVLPKKQLLCVRFVSCTEYLVSHFQNFCYFLVSHCCNKLSFINLWHEKFFVDMMITLETADLETRNLIQISSSSFSSWETTI